MTNCLTRTSVRLLIIAFVAVTAAFSAGCTSMSDEGSKPAEIEKKFSGDTGKPKSIYVFHDGTRNDAGSGTNVRKLFEAVMAANDPQSTAIYIAGVGSASTPLLGAGLGFGMEERMIRGYDFIAQSYRPGDAIYIFGFSRGAHSARALAGLVAYAGLPPASTEDASKRFRTLNRVLEIVKRKDDDRYTQTWKSWQPGSAAPVAEESRLS